MSPSTGRHVLIAGGGLSGLCLAQGLLKDGHTVELYERDADLTRKIGYYLHMNGDGGGALRRCLPDDLYELYLETSRKTYERRFSFVLDEQLNELSAQPHFGPPNDGERPHTGVNRRTLRGILLSGLEDVVRTGRAAVGYDESDSGVTLHLSDGSTATGDVLVGADGIRSAIRRQKLPEVSVVETGIEGIGVYGRAPMTPELRAIVPPALYEGVLIATDRRSRMLLAAFQPRREIATAPADIAPQVVLEPVPDYFMVSATLAEGTVVPPKDGWDDSTPAMLRDAMLKATEGWHPAARALLEGLDLSSIFVIPFGYLEPPAPWEPSRVTLVGDAAHAMLPTLGMGANLAMRDAAHLLDQLSADRDALSPVPGIGVYEAEMREYVYPFMRMTMEHDKNFGGGALQKPAD